MKKSSIFILLFLFSVYTNGQAKKLLNYTFPLPRPHMGMIIGNGTQGLMIYGSANVLNISIGQNGFWDHRGANELKKLTNYQNFKALVSQKGKVGSIFGGSKSEGMHRQIGGGNLEIKFPTGYQLKKGVLDLLTATATIYLATADGKEASLTVRQLIKPANEFQFAWVEDRKSVV